MRLFGDLWIFLWGFQVLGILNEKKGTEIWLVRKKTLAINSFQPALRAQPPATPVSPELLFLCVRHRLFQLGRKLQRLRERAGASYGFLWSSWSTHLVSDIFWFDKQNKSTLWLCITPCGFPPSDLCKNNSTMSRLWAATLQYLVYEGSLKFSSREGNERSRISGKCKGSILSCFLISIHHVFMIMFSGAKGVEIAMI